MQKRLINIFLCIVCVSYLYAQDLEFIASAPNSVRAGEQFQVQFTINKNISEFVPPDFENFELLDGPMQSSSSYSSYANGKIVNITNKSFIYILQATKTGKYTIDPAKAVYKKDEITSNALTIEVIAASQNQTNAQSTASNSQNQSGPTTREESDDEIFFSLVLDKNTAYVGEQINAFVKIYTKIPITSVDFGSYKGPDFTGFFRNDVKMPDQIGLTNEKVGNQVYKVAVLNKIIIYPQKAGVISIAPFDITIYTEKLVKQRTVFGTITTYSDVPVNLRTKAVTVNVKALPQPQPANYNGAVGQFDIAASLNSNHVRTNDAVSFRVSLSGKGNIKLIENIKSEIPASFEIYDPIIKLNLDNSGNSGTKIFEITAIPRHAGKYDINPFSLVYFDPISGTYKTIQTQTFTLEVDKGTGDSSQVLISNLNKEDVELLGSDIRFIKTSTSIKKSDSYLIDSFYYYLVFIVGVVSLLLVFVFKKEQIKRGADLISAKHRKASKLANRRFKVARHALNQNHFDKFYEELSKALWGYLSDKLAIPVSSLSTESALEKLTIKGVETTLSQNYLNIISHCEYARYARGASDKSPSEIYNDAVKILLTIDQKL